jgi:hypothetical protein
LTRNLRKSKYRPSAETLEGRRLMASQAFSGVTSQLAGGVLAIVGDNQPNSIRVSNPDANTVQLTVTGPLISNSAPTTQTQTFAATAVRSIVIRDGNGDDSIINLTQIPSTIVAGNGNDYVNTGDPSRLGTGANDTIRLGNGDDVVQDSGGTDTISVGNGNDVVFAYGKDNIVAGNGANTLYNIVGSGNIVAGNGANHIITNNNFAVNSGPNTLPIYRFGGKAAPVQLDPNGILYFTSATGNATVTVNDNGDGTITSVYTNDATGTNETDTFQSSQVKGIGAIFGKGSGTFTNNTSIENVAYGGAAGNNVLIGGSGWDFMKSNSANDVIIGGQAGAENILSEGGQNGTIVGGTGVDVIAAGFSGTATVISTGTVDVVVGDPGPGSLLVAQKTRTYH